MLPVIKITETANWVTISPFLILPPFNASLLFFKIAEVLSADKYKAGYMPANTAQSSVIPKTPITKTGLYNQDAAISR
jgi:hypothetical protein